ncbi:hypothetical protein [Longimicrobium sp.]|uniref:hypothetical protein n=1 Tax=Longimicrobium sp. TaxID=2029185 RepID=UPI003B3B9D5F
MSHRILPAALLLCALAAACGENPAGSDTHAQPAGPAYDGGFTMGSGNSATQSSGYTIGSGNNEVEGGFTIGSVNEATEDDGLAPSTAPISDDAAGRGGFTMGSGN